MKIKNTKSQIESSEPWVKPRVRNMGKADVARECDKVSVRRVDRTAGNSTSVWRPTHPPFDWVYFGGVGTSSIRSTEWWYLICDLRSVDNRSETWCTMARE